ncbi:hypothetical protein K470DRAFT_279035 [Piedraia hortae CBS 480.64]|uniref:Sister chromatid cohesion acetyltransferase Eco1 n=1 Tax=Piedraia hortae CBS 480.64 TaxID=1314780 RepID=A0A6A7BRE2_9PEZI|nr:hypothetical protein K470DRAFT_279035 [Piedraia hortae CBS 480.64]
MAGVLTGAGIDHVFNEVKVKLVVNLEAEKIVSVSEALRVIVSVGIESSNSSSEHDSELHYEGVNDGFVSVNEGKGDFIVNCAAVAGTVKNWSAPSALGEKQSIVMLDNVYTILHMDSSDLSSSPVGKIQLFSDIAQRSLSPPSSPPAYPGERQSNNKYIAPSAFAVLGKRKSATPVTHAARPTKKRSACDRLTQLQINLGQTIQKQCPTCGMEYVASSAEDRKLHDRYHQQAVDGYDVGKEFAGKARLGTVFPGVLEGDWICAITHLDHHTRRKKVQSVLESVQRELGAVPISAQQLWASSKDRGPHFTAYLYVRGTKCVGFALTVGLSEARLVLKPQVNPTKPILHHSVSAVEALKLRRLAAAEAEAQATSQPLLVSSVPVPARLGIARIWTSPRCRCEGIASSLLDTALASTKPLTKDDVAFSQPTEAGTRLARKWFGQLYGWKAFE